MTNLVYGCRVVLLQGYARTILGHGVVVGTDYTQSPAAVMVKLDGRDEPVVVGDYLGSPTMVAEE